MKSFRSWIAAFGVLIFASFPFQNFAVAGAVRTDVVAIPWTIQDNAPMAAVLDTYEPLPARSREYEVMNQVGQTWRETADVFAHIDPGRRVAI